jgi:hypothetical protein
VIEHNANERNNTNNNATESMTDAMMIMERFDDGLLSRSEINDETLGCDAELTPVISNRELAAHFSFLHCNDAQGAFCSYGDVATVHGFPSKQPAIW